MNQNNRIAIVCDWLIDFGGAELVISHLLELFPEADIYTSVCFMDHPMLQGRRVYTSWLQRVPFLGRKHKLAGILRPWAFRSFDLTWYDVVICSSSAESKQVAMGKWKDKTPLGGGDVLRSETEGDAEEISPPTPPHRGVTQPITTHQLPLTICYCHTPTRYYWSHAREYEDMLEFGWMNPLVKMVFRLVKGWMQRVDLEAAKKVDYFIANSRTTEERIKKYYDRESTVIYPGVESRLLSFSEGESLPSSSEKILATQGGQKKEEYYLGVGRCIPYKKFDLLVDTFNANGKKLILCTGTDTKLYRELRARSKPNIEWRFAVSNEEKNKLMAGAKAFLFPPEEDFGLVPVEAMMMGTPVIAYGKGGTTESVVDGKTGVFFDAQKVDSLDEAIERFEQMDFDRASIREHAKSFSKEVFQKQMIDFIESRV